MTMEEALGNYLTEQNIAKARSGRELYADKWFYASVFGRQLPFFPKAGFRGGLAAHDGHHMLNGYATNLTGECEVAAWELASGGCGRHFAYWIDRLSFMAIAVAIAPARSVRAWRRGWGQRNLYRLPSERLLAMDLSEGQLYIDGDSQPPKRTSW